jgi:hypothetical protein
MGGNAVLIGVASYWSEMLRINWRCVVWVGDESYNSEIRQLIGDTAY